MNRFEGNILCNDLGVTVDRLCIGNYLLVAPNDKFQEAIEVVAIDKDYIVGEKSNGIFERFKYEDLRGMPMSEFVMQQKGWKYGGSVSFDAVLLKGTVSLKPKEDSLIPFYICKVGDEPIAVIRCVHEWQNLMKHIQGHSMVNKDLTTMINNNGGV